jgi:hypothetical protein
VRLKSFTSSAWYNISLDRRSCDCSYFQKANKPCKHLNALGVHSKARPFIPKSHPTFSQALSALVKAIRVRRVEDAVYWLVYLDGYSNEKRNRYRIARRLLIGSAEDGHSVAVMEEIVNQFSNLMRVETDLLYLATEAVRICKVPNWWDPVSGGPDYIYSGMVARRILWQFPERPAVQNMTRLIEEGIAQKNRPMALAGVMGLSEAKMGATKQAEAMLSLAKRHQHLLAERLAEIHLHAKSALSHDNNFLCQAVWMMAGGNSPVAEVAEPVSDIEVSSLLDEARERWKDPKPIPRWCCDGTHSAGDDPRFMGTWEHMFGVCRAFAHYGRVDPTDKWLPSFQCYDGLTVEEGGPDQGPISAINCKNLQLDLGIS